MPIALNTPNTGTRYPTIRRREIGQVYIGMLCKEPEQRDRLDQQRQPIRKPDGKARQELVITLLTLPGTTMPAGSGQGRENDAVPAPGDIVRLIVKGKAFSEWIDADKDLPGRQVGDVLTLTNTFGQAYDFQGNAVGGTLATQAEVDAVPRGNQVGVYGPLALRRAEPAEAPWVTQAEAAYASMQAPTALATQGAPTGGVDPDDI